MLVAAWAKLLDRKCVLPVLLLFEVFVVFIVGGDVIKVSTNSTN
jgi:hypothetical protein